MSKGLAMRESYRLEQWCEIIAQCQRGELSVKNYCNNQGITPNSYYYYLRKIRNLEASDPKLVPVVFEKAEANPLMVSIHYYGAIIEMTANDETSLCAVFSALKKV